MRSEKWKFDYLRNNYKTRIYYANYKECVVFPHICYISCVQAAGLFHFLKIYDNIKKGINSRVDSFQTIVSVDVVAAVVWPDFSI